jgi:Phosphoribosyltransferase
MRCCRGGGAPAWRNRRRSFGGGGDLGRTRLAAVAGATLAARSHEIPMLLDGFVATAAVVPLVRRAKTQRTGGYCH